MNYVLLLTYIYTKYQHYNRCLTKKVLLKQQRVTTTAVSSLRLHNTFLSPLLCCSCNSVSAWRAQRVSFIAVYFQGIHIFLNVFADFFSLHGEWGNFNGFEINIYIYGYMNIFFYRYIFYIYIYICLCNEVRTTNLKNQSSADRIYRNNIAVGK